MSPKALTTLKDASEFVLKEAEKGTPAEQVILAMIKLFGAKRSVSGNSFTLRCGTVRASCSWSRDKGLLDGWRKNAVIALAQERMA